MCINPWKGQDSGAGWSVSGMGVNQLNNVCSSINIQMMQMGWQIGKNFRMWPGRPIPTQIITFIGVQRRFDSGDSRYSGRSDRQGNGSITTGEIWLWHVQMTLQILLLQSQGTNYIIGFTQLFLNQVWATQFHLERQTRKWEEDQQFITNLKFSLNRLFFLSNFVFIFFWCGPSHKLYTLST